MSALGSNMTQALCPSAPPSLSWSLFLPDSPDNDQTHFQSASHNPFLSSLTGPTKQGHTDCCKRKMYHLLGDG